MRSRISSRTIAKSGTALRRLQPLPPREVCRALRNRGVAITGLVGMLLATTLVIASPARADELVLSPTEAPVGATVTVQPGITDLINPERICSVFWDGQVDPVTTFACGTDEVSGLATIDLRAPAPPGSHVMTVTCPTCPSTVYGQSWSAKADFTTLSTVPALTGLSYGDATVKQRLDEAGLLLGSQSGSPGPGAKVSWQNPKAGTVVEPDSAVDLRFELIPPQLVRVPDLLGLEQRQAVRLLGANQLTLGTVTGTGLITWQRPAAERLVPRGTPVNVVLALPRIHVQPVIVPDLTGLTKQQAEQLLVANQLSLGPATGTGRIIEQDPLPQSQAEPNSKVRVKLGQSLRDPLVTVPDVKGLSGPDAGRRLNVHRLTLGTVSGAGRVSRQLPEAGAKVPPGTAVDIMLTSPPPPLVTVPDIRGLKVSDARTRIRDDGLQLATEGATTGLVVSQRPSAGSRMARGSTVTATVRQPAVGVAVHRPIRWAGIAILALAALVVSTAGWLTRKLWPKARTASRGLPRRYPAGGEHVDVRCQAAPPNLKITTVGSTASPVRVTVHGRDPNIKLKEVQT